MQEAKQKILLIKPILPFPPNQGSRALSFSLIRSLSNHFDITVLARILSKDEKDNVAALSKLCHRVIAIHAPNKKSLFHRAAYKVFYILKSLFIKRSIRSMYDCPGAFVRAARRLAKEEFDLVIVEYWQLYKIFPLFPRNKLVLLTHDIDMLVNRNASLLEKNLLKKIKAVRRWIIEKGEEMKAYRYLDMIFTLTERDSDMVKKIKKGVGRVQVLPFPMDVAYFSEVEGTRNDKEVLFLGALEAAFNQDALRHFVKNIYPCLHDIEDMAITIVGGELPEDLLYFKSNPEVEVVGRVADVRPYLRRAACLIVPLRFGGGLRIRILEAMASGLTVICTGVAIEGMPFKAGEDYLRADEPREFREQIGKVLESKEFRGRIAGNAYRGLIKNYSADTQEEKLEHVIQRIIDSQNLMI